MNITCKGPLLALVIGALLASSAATAHATVTWVDTPSGSTGTITALEYQVADRFWFATGNGQIFRRVNGNFEKVLDAPGKSFIDIEMQPGAGQIGLAVGTAGTVYRTVDTGATWQPIAPASIPVTSSSCTGSATPLADVQQVKFATDTTVFLSGAAKQIARSDNAGATWVDANRISDGNCRYSRGIITSAFWVPGSNPLVGYFTEAPTVGTKVSTTTDGFTSPLTTRPASVNYYDGYAALAGDPANAERQWMGSGQKGTYTTDAWGTARAWNLLKDTTEDGDVFDDIAYSGGTVLSAGRGGVIANSINGEDFTLVGPKGDLADVNWHAVDLASATLGAVGGDGGKLVLTETANVLADVGSPSGTISGPTSSAANADATFTVTATDPEGGSGIDPGSFSWTATGLAAKTGTSATFRWPTTGSKKVTVTFSDREGNTASVDKTVNVTAPAAPPPTGTQTTPTGTTTPTVTRDTVITRLGITFVFTNPSKCVGVGKTIKGTLKARKLGKRKIARIEFRIDNKKKGRKIDRKAPFTQKLSTKGLKPGKHALNAIVKFKGRKKAAKLKVNFKVC